MRLLRWLPRFRRATRAMPLLRAREGWSRADLEAFQLDRLNALWDHARTHVPHYRELAGGLPSRWASLEEFRAGVPLLRRDQVQGRQRRFLSERAGPGHWSQTGGSTGEPLQVFWGRDAHEQNMQARDRSL